MGDKADYGTEQTGQDMTWGTKQTMGQNKRDRTGHGGQSRLWDRTSRTRQDTGDKADYGRGQDTGDKADYGTGQDTGDKADYGTGQDTGDKADYGTGQAGHGGRGLLKDERAQQHR